MAQATTIKAGNITIIRNLLSHEGQSNTQPVLYKKTAVAFRKQYGIELEGAPVVFVAKETIWKLSHRTQVWRGRTYEYADYLPIVGVADKFQRLQRADILV